MTAIPGYVSRSWRNRRVRRSPDRYLADGETEVFLTHRHWAVLLRPAMPAALSLIVAFVGGLVFGPGLLSAILWVLTVPFILWLAWRIVEHRFERIVLTNRRIIVITGIIIRKVGMMPFAQVTDLGYTRSILGQLLDYGAVRLETAGQVQDLEHIRFIPNPDAFYRFLSSLVLGPGTMEADQVSLLREIRDRLS
jgi:membrane protein YdbS with pleckstrin-like domain